MNKSYKVLFNRVRGVATAVSEIASSHQARKKATAVAVAVAMGMMAGSAMATTDTYYGAGTSGNWQWAPSSVEDPMSASLTDSVQSGFTKTWDGTTQATIKYLFGGHSIQSQNVTNNIVTATGGTIEWIYGGYSLQESAGTTKGTGNTVIVSGGTIAANSPGGFFRIAGGYAGSDGDSANYNTVSISGDQTNIGNDTVDTNGKIYGGTSEKDSTQVTTSNNEVVIDGGTFTHVTDVYGGLCGGSAHANVIDIKKMTGGSVGNVVGGSAMIAGGTGASAHLFDVSESAADQTEGAGNYVSISGGEVTGDVFGGQSLKYYPAGNATAQSANFNTVAIGGGTFSGSGKIIYGGDVWVGGTPTGNPTITASNNKVTISGGTFNGQIVYGGYTKLDVAGTETASGNAVEITGMTSGSLGSVYGGYSSTGTAGTTAGTGNSVTISGGTFNSNIYGGFGGGGSANYNTVNISDSPVFNNPDDGVEIVGGSSFTASASNNEVTINGGFFNPSTGIYVLGGQSYQSSADNNTVEISSVENGSSFNYIRGGYGNSVSANRVLVSAGNITGSIDGGYSDTESNHNEVVVNGQTTAATVSGGSIVWGNSGSTYSNSVTVSGESVISLYLNGGVVGGSGDAGGDHLFDVSKSAKDQSGRAGNYVCVVESATVKGTIYGGYTIGGSANYNTVSISGGTIVTDVSKIDIVGGYTNSTATGTDVKSVSNNLVSISGGTFTQDLANSKFIDVYGGQATNTATASANSVLISGMSGSVHNVYGGYSYLGSANNNTVIINGGSIGSNVYGGYALNGTPTNNAVIWKSGTISGDVSSGYSSGSSIGNVLAIIGAKPYQNQTDKQYSVSDISGQNFLFVINDKSVIQTGTLSANSGQVMLKAKNAPNLDNSDKYHVAVAFADGFDASQVREGSKTVLMNVDAYDLNFTQTDADTIILGLEDGGNTYAAATLAKSVSKVNEYDFSISEETISDKSYLVAELTGIAPNDLTLSTRDIAYANLVNFRSQMNDVALRMGELRTSKNAGGWARIYGGTYSFGEGRKDKSFTLQVGADRWFDANSYVGLMGSYTKAEDTLTNGENDQKNWNVGFYGGYIADSGLFWDATVRHGKIENKYNLSSLTPVSGKYSTYGTSASVEGGWRFDCPSTNFYIEPQGELMYGHMQSVTYNAGDVTIKNDAVNTFVGRVGVAAGYKFAEDQGNLYLRTSLLHDFKGKVKTQAVSGNETDGGFTKDFGGTWGEFVLGGNYKASKSVNLYGEMTCSTKNAGVRTKWQGSVGARWTF